MRITLAAVGRLRPAFREACDDYRSRLARWVDVQEVEVREAGRAGSPEVQRRQESRSLLAAVPGRATIVLLDRAGAPWSSEELAERIRQWQEQSRPLALLIGGAAGVDDTLREAASACWSLGPLTLPHELARVVVLEQVYRGFTILHRLPYHKGPM